MIGRGSRQHDERGAVAVFTAAIVVVLMISAAFAVDLGQQRVVRADMQALADAVALDAARVLDGRPAGRIRTPLESDGKPSLQAAVDASVARNSTTLGDVVSVTPTLVFLTSDVNGALVPQRINGSLVAVPDGEVPDAVLIEAEGKVDFGFARVIGVSSGGATRSAIADAQPVACLAVGSYAAGISSQQSVLLDSLLGDLLGSDVDLTLAGYQGLANAEVTLLELIDGLSLADVSTLDVATVERVLGTEVTVAQLATAAVSALGEEDEEVTAALNTLAGAIGGAVDLGLLDDLTLGELLGITQGGEAALSASLNVLDLVVAGVQVANGEYAIEVPDLSISTDDLPAGLGSLLPLIESTGSVGVLPRPKMGCGPEGTTVRTAAVELQDVELSVGVGGLPGGSLAGLDVEPIGVEVDLASAESTASLLDIKCGDASSVEQAEGIDVAVASTLAGLSVALDPVTVRGTILGNQVDLSLSLKGPVATTPSSPGPSQQFRNPPDAYDAPMEFGSGSVVTGLVPSATSLRVDGSISVVGYSLITVTDGAADLSGLPLAVRLVLNPIVSAVLSIVTSTLVPTVVSSVVNPVLSLVNYLVADVLGDVLGLTVAGADVFAIPRPSCNSVVLLG